jgi:hypothetical protein
MTHDVTTQESIRSHPDYLGILTFYRLIMTGHVLLPIMCGWDLSDSTVKHITEQHKLF